MSKKSLIFFFIIILAMLAISFSACDKENGDIHLKVEVRPQSQSNGYMYGYVGDTDYAAGEGIDILFGEDLTYAATTDENGEFSFYYYDPIDYPSDKIIDFIHIDLPGYKYKAFLGEHEEFEKNVESIVVITQDTDFDMNSVTANYIIKCTFYQSGVVLPEGYPSANKDINERINSTAGENSITGVSIYADDVFLQDSDIDGFRLKYVIPQTELKLVKEGFSFRYRLGGSTDIRPMPDNIYVFSGNEYALLEFRGEVDDFFILLR